jgi:hypothetical protein
MMLSSSAPLICSPLIFATVAGNFLEDGDWPRVEVVKMDNPMHIVAKLVFQFILILHITNNGLFLRRWQ